MWSMLTARAQSPKFNQAWRLTLVIPEFRLLRHGDQSFKVILATISTETSLSFKVSYLKREPVVIQSALLAYLAVLSCSVIWPQK